MTNRVNSTMTGEREVAMVKSSVRLWVATAVELKRQVEAAHLPEEFFRPETVTAITINLRNAGCTALPANVQVQPLSNGRKLMLA